MHTHTRHANTDSDTTKRGTRIHGADTSINLSLSRHGRVAAGATASVAAAAPAAATDY